MMYFVGNNACTAEKSRRNCHCLPSGVFPRLSSHAPTRDVHSITLVDEHYDRHLQAST